MNSGKTGN